MNTISVGQLRQNPTQMLRNVRAGAIFTVTDHGEPIAQVVPLRQSSWVPIDQVNQILEELPADPEWAAEIYQDRWGDHPRDPWKKNQ